MSIACYNELSRYASMCGVDASACLRFASQYDTSWSGSLAAPEYDPQASEDDFDHIQSSEMTIATDSMIVTAHIEWKYLHNIMSPNMTWRREGTCECGVEIDDVLDELPTYVHLCNACT